MHGNKHQECMGLYTKFACQLCMKVCMYTHVCFMSKGNMMMETSCSLMNVWYIVKNVRLKHMHTWLCLRLYVCFSRNYLPTKFWPLYVVCALHNQQSKQYKHGGVYTRCFTAHTVPNRFPYITRQAIDKVLPPPDFQPSHAYNRRTRGDICLEQGTPWKE